MSTQSKINAVIVVALAAALAMGIQRLKKRRRWGQPLYKIGNPD